MQNYNFDVLAMIWHEIVKIWKDLKYRNTELFLFWFLDLQNNFTFPSHKNSQKQVKNQKSTDKHLSFDGLIQEGIDLSDIYLAVYWRNCDKILYFSNQ